MQIFLLGATGNTGHEVLKRLLAENHTVKLLVRDPSKLNTGKTATTPAAMVIGGEVRDAEKLNEHFKGCSAVISALGTGLNNVITEIYSVGGRNILNAMRANGVRK